MGLIVKFNDDTVAYLKIEEKSSKLYYDVFLSISLKLGILCDNCNYLGVKLQILMMNT